ncbi:MAG: amidohydrolase family protein [Planctomycetota bacterium]|jgi:imidazolonepropionase-like amidohydrolase
MMRRFAAAAACLLLAGPLPAQEPPAPHRLALVGGDVYTESGELLRDATVLIEGDRITAVGAAVTVPDGTPVIDCAGKRLVPGFIAVQASSSMVLSGSGKVGDRLNAYDSDMDLALAGGVTTLHVPTGSTTSAVIRLTKGEITHMLGRDGVTQVLRSATAGGAERATLREGLAAARAHLRALRAYEAAKKARQKVTPPQPSSAARAYLPFVVDRTIARVRASSTADILRACEVAEEFDLRMILEDVVEGWAVADRIARAKAGCIISPRRVVPSDPDTARPTGSHPSQPKLLRDAGVRLAVIPPSTRVGTGGIGGRDLGTLALSAAFAVRGGLTPAEALRAITIDAARLLGIDDETGSIAPGKWADIVICDGDPLDYRTFATHTIVAGKVRYEKATHPLFQGTRAGDRPADALPPRPGEDEGK